MDLRDHLRFAAQHRDYSGVLRRFCRRVAADHCDHRIFSPLPYNLLVDSSEWRSAERYSGPAIWAVPARAEVVAWAIAATAF